MLLNQLESPHFQKPCISNQWQRSGKCCLVIIRRLLGNPLTGCSLLRHWRWHTSDIEGQKTDITEVNTVDRIRWTISGIIQCRQCATFVFSLNILVAPLLHSRSIRLKKAVDSISSHIVSDTGQLGTLSSRLLLFMLSTGDWPLIIQVNKLLIKRKVESQHARREPACQLQTCLDPVGFIPLNTSH